MELYAGLDLHSRNTYIGTIANEFNPVLKKRVPNKGRALLASSDDSAILAKISGIIQIIPNPDFIPVYS